MKIVIPDLSVVVLVGVHSSGKSTFARRWFLPEEIVSKDTCPEVRQCVQQRLQQGLLAVVDDTNIFSNERKPYVELARQYHAPAVAIVLKLPVEVCLERNAARGDAAPPEDTVRFQAEKLAQLLHTLNSGGFQQVYVLTTPDEVESVSVVRVPLPPCRFKSDRGPFDIVGDVHGCYDELMELLKRLGWRTGDDLPTHPEGRKLVFLGDFGDRGPNSVGVFQLAMRMTGAGIAYAVIGNHDYKLQR
ncbi:MAG: AAA family ATPase, partial [Fimbriimonadales bacterium]|nr:AAA family ATPase [Fimbriimonadales bacterium]